jgi:hypothetical protein
MPETYQAVEYERDQLRVKNARLHRALKMMVKEFGYDRVHPHGLVHDEHMAIMYAMEVLRDE